jgi:hypothetical protein
VPDRTAAFSCETKRETVHNVEKDCEKIYGSRSGVPLHFHAKKSIMDDEK